MSKFNCYAVRAGRVPGIYSDWEECRNQVISYPKQEYKGFKTLAEAEAYMTTGKARTTDQQIKNSPELSPVAQGNHLDIFTDGSYENWQYSWAFAAYQDSILVHSDSGLGLRNDVLPSRNVAGELEAVMNAVLWAEVQGIPSVTIHHDYTGISAWATGEWKRNKSITKEYAEFMKSRLGWVSFNKVSAHSGIEGNELADKLAGEAIKRETSGDS